MVISDEERMLQQGWTVMKVDLCLVLVGVKQNVIIDAFLNFQPL